MSNKQIKEYYKNSLESFLEEYKKQKEEVATLHQQYESEFADNETKVLTQLDEVYSKLEDTEKELYDSFCVKEIFLKQAASAGAFVKASTCVRIEQNEGFDGLECVSLIKSAVEYGENLTILSGGFNKEWNKLLDEVAPFNSKEVSRMEFDSLSETPIRMISEIKTASKNLLGDDEPLRTLTVGDVASAIDDVDLLKERYHISRDNVIDDTLNAIRCADFGLYQMYSFGVDTKEPVKISSEQAKELYEQGYRADNTEQLVKLGYSITQTDALAVLLKTYEEHGIDEESVNIAKIQLDKERIPVEIVESFDGYVINTNQEINASNEKEFNEKVENKNEVIHKEAPMETSVNLSEIGGRVKYEEHDDIGTIEKAEGVLSYNESKMKKNVDKRKTINEKTNEK